MPDHAVDVASLVEYQDGAVVSRTVIKDPAGTVTLFAFDAGEALSEHAAPFDALLQVIEGTAEVTLAGTAHAMGTGQIILLPANIPHALRATERFKMMLTMIRTRAAESDSEARVER
jgi:quercetin dioxygenase-like cupin family protein